MFVKQSGHKLEYHPTSAMEEEMRALDPNDTWNLVDRPWHSKQIGCKWVYEVKFNADGSINRYKAKLVAKGYA